MYEHSFRERAVGRVWYMHAFPREGLEYVPVVQTVVVGVGVHVGER